MVVEGILRRQGGVISRSQALAAGMSEDQVDRRLGAGRWMIKVGHDHRFGKNTLTYERQFPKTVIMTRIVSGLPGFSDHAA